MKKKILLGIAIFFFGIFAIYKILGFKGYLKIYTIPTTSSSPALEVGDYIIVSNLTPVKRNDFVVFKRFDENLGLVNFVFRMVAKEGDTLSIVNGSLIVNTTNIDQLISTKHSYKAHKNIFKEQALSHKNSDYHPISNDSILIFLEDKIASSILPKITKANATYPVHETFSKDWDSYNFGPLIIPENMFFVMGDNRDNAMDSRYIGLINESNYIGTAINVN